MSLRDQLLKAGLVDKKTHQRVNRDLKKKRRKHKGKRDKRSTREARQAQAQQQALDAAIQKRTAERRKNLARREEQDRKRLIGNLVRSYRLPPKRGPVPFFHLTPDRQHCHRMWLPESWAWDLRRGALAIAWDGEDADNPEYIVLPAGAAQRILKHAPERVLFLNDTAPPKDDPSEKLFAVE